MPWVARERPLPRREWLCNRPKLLAVKSLRVTGRSEGGALQRLFWVRIAHITNDMSPKNEETETG